MIAAAIAELAIIIITNSVNTHFLIVKSPVGVKVSDAILRPRIIAFNGDLGND